MALLHIVVLALVQGITEFLPISSSAHLILVPVAFGWPDQGMLIDVAVHVGTLAAVMVYFWRDVAAMAAGLLDLLRGRLSGRARLVMLVALATLPVLAAGYLLSDMMESLRDVRVIGWTTLVFGLALYGADRAFGQGRAVEGMTMRDAAIVGVAQVLALIPGTSRSGITMTAARALGLGRSDAARFSLLLSMPTILGAGVLAGLELQRQDSAALTDAAMTAAGLAFVSALVAIAAMMAWLRRATFTPFVVYRVILGVVLLAFGYGVL